MPSEQVGLIFRNFLLDNKLLIIIRIGMETDVCHNDNVYHYDKISALQLNLVIK